MNLLAVLPMAIVMIAGPQIVSAFFFATGDDPRRTSLGYLSGIAATIILGTSVAYWLAHLLTRVGGPPNKGTAGTIVDWVVVGLLVLLAVIVFARRGKSDPPKWMTTLQEAAPSFALRLGFLLFLVMPTDVVTMLSVGGGGWRRRAIRGGTVSRSSG